jgi:arsenite methyltransferase
VNSFAHDSAELARTYDRLSDSQFEGGKRLCERLELQAGQPVLDVGCGTGRLARWVAEKVGAGNVFGIDPLPERIAIARTQGAGVSFEVGQAEDLGAFGNQTFDAVCMSAVFHWVKDKPKALGEVQRVLRPGGRLGITTYPRELRLTGTTARVCGLVLTNEPYRSRINLADIAVAQSGANVTDLISMLAFAGLEILELHVVRRTSQHASGADAVDFLQSSSFGNFLRMVPDDLQASFRADVAAAFEARKGPDGIVMNDHGVLAVATRLE